MTSVDIYYESSPTRLAYAKPTISLPSLRKVLVILSLAAASWGVVFGLVGLSRSAIGLLFG